MFLGFFTWYRGLAIGPLASVSQIQLVQPEMSIVWAALILHEQLTFATFAGGVVVALCATLAVRTRLGRPAVPYLHTPIAAAEQNMLALADQLHDAGAGLRVRNLGGGDVDTAIPMGSMLFTIIAALGQMELEIRRERITDSVSKRREAGMDLGGRRQQITDSQIGSAIHLVDGGTPAARK